jgi:hypothetical protein
MLTAIGPPVGTGAADAAAGARTIAIANKENSEQARTAMRKEPSDILYPGTLTSRQKRYAAEPVPDTANLPLIDEGTGNGAEKAPSFRGALFARTRNPETAFGRGFRVRSIGLRFAQSRWRAPE